eukprot:CAMPEP_0171300912 /NCGR_PEP_ID=MMETSP0816-20121228/9916_1 /TAXON_ID=420281 /ORGANISM="Proboscia inermis, Strain CCAP1064/1" /LENGTH=266 /DNA_ID=CAMNT_0011777957 /DNA_START=32 /DNA_END=832 /DNA_ORIENTATION=-
MVAVLHMLQAAALVSLCMKSEAFTSSSVTKIFALKSSSSQSNMMEMNDVADSITNSCPESFSSFLTSLLKTPGDPSEAKSLFWFSLGAGSGAGGIGLRAIPNIIDDYKKVQSLANSSPALGGETLNINPVAMLKFPEPLSVRDFEKVVKTSKNGATISKQSSNKSYLVSLGYVDQSDFLDSLKGCNALAAYAVFEAIAGGKGKVVSPIEFDEKLSIYKTPGGNDAFINDLQIATYTRLSSYIALFFLLGIIADFVIESYIYGWMSG